MDAYPVEAMGTAMEAVGYPAVTIGAASSSTVTTSSTTDGVAAGAGFFVGFFFPPRNGMAPPPPHKAQQQQRRQYRRSQNHHGRPNFISVVVVVLSVTVQVILYQLVPICPHIPLWNCKGPTAVPAHVVSGYSLTQKNPVSGQLLFGSLTDVVGEVSAQPL